MILRTHSFIENNLLSKEIMILEEGLRPVFIQPTD